MHAIGTNGAKSCWRCCGSSLASASDIVGDTTVCTGSGLVCVSLEAPFGMVCVLLERAAAVHSDGARHASLSVCHALALWFGESSAGQTFVWLIKSLVAHWESRFKTGAIHPESRSYARCSVMLLLPLARNTTVSYDRLGSVRMVGLLPLARNSVTRRSWLFGSRLEHSRTWLGRRLRPSANFDRELRACRK